MASHLDTMEHMEEEHGKILSDLKDYCQSLEDNEVGSYLISVSEKIVAAIEKTYSELNEVKRSNQDDESEEAESLDNAIKSLRTELESVEDTLTNGYQVMKDGNDSEINALADEIESSNNKVQDKWEDVESISEVMKIEKMIDDISESIKTIDVECTNLISTIDDEIGNNNDNERYKLVGELEDFKDLLWYRQGSPSGERLISSVKNQVTVVIDMLENKEVIDELRESISVLESDIQKALEWFEGWNTK
ncbi:hypothetical protein [Mammaliicoccus sciuri]|uniref:hypothetical protein n=1 Tax=Mammaliicoccus sciuri TaxID=1296 RepID=UPI003F54B63D